MKAKIENVYNNLSKVDKKIADYFLVNANNILNMNIHELSAAIGTSSASVSRFVRRVFGKNFAQTKIEIAKSIENMSIENAQEIFDWAIDFDEMPKNIISHIELICNDVLDFNEISKFKEAVELLSVAENVYLFGVGSSGVIAQDMRQKLIKLKKRALYTTDSNFGVLNSMICTSKDVVIAFSYSGHTKEVNVAVEKAKEKGAKIITVTGNIKCKLRTLSDISLVVPSVELNESRLAAIFSRYGQLFVVDVLFVGLAKRLSNSPNQLLSGYKELLFDLKDNR